MQKRVLRHESRNMQHASSEASEFQSEARKKLNSEPPAALSISMNRTASGVPSKLMRYEDPFWHLGMV
jgi:hypothetical protein